MSHSEDPGWDDEDFGWDDEDFGIMRRHFSEQLLFFVDVRDSIEPDGRFMLSNLRPMMGMLFDQGKAFHNCCQELHIVPALTLSRPILELAINVCFICSKGDDGAGQAGKHASQKIIRSLKREFDLSKGKVKVAHTSAEAIMAHPGFREAIEEFTSKSGRELTRWTDENIAQRIEVIEQKFGSSVADDFRWALFWIYGNSSEVIHGTLFGALYCYGETNLGKRPGSFEEFQDHVRSQLVLLNLFLGNCLAACTEVIAETFPQDQLNEIRAKSKTAYKTRIEEFGDYYKKKDADAGD